MTRLKSQITNPKSQINSKIQIQITKTQKSLPSPGRLCHNEGNGMFVILNEVKNLMESIS